MNTLGPQKAGLMVEAQPNFLRIVPPIQFPLRRTTNSIVNAISGSESPKSVGRVLQLPKMSQM